MTRSDQLAGREPQERRRFQGGTVPAEFDIIDRLVEQPAVPAADVEQRGSMSSVPLDRQSLFCPSSSDASQSCAISKA